MKLQYSFTLLIAFAIIVVFYSCKEKKQNEKYYNNGNLKEMIISGNDSDKINTVYTFYETGGIKELHRLNDKKQFYGEQLWFFENGRLDRKISVYNNIAKGNAYYFYDSNGALKNFRFFRNDKEALYGGDYWGDSMDLMKASIHFNDSGQVFYKKNFDENGKFISEEGKKE